MYLIIDLPENIYKKLKLLYDFEVLCRKTYHDQYHSDTEFIAPTLDEFCAWPLEKYINEAYERIRR